MCVSKERWGREWGWEIPFRPEGLAGSAVCVREIILSPPSHSLLLHLGRPLCFSQYVFFFPIGSINIWRAHYLLQLLNLVVLSLLCLRWLGSSCAKCFHAQAEDWTLFAVNFFPQRSFPVTPKGRWNDRIHIQCLCTDLPFLLSCLLQLEQIQKHTWYM